MLVDIVESNSRHVYPQENIDFLEQQKNERWLSELDTMMMIKTNETQNKTIFWHTHSDSPLATSLCEAIAFVTISVVNNRY